MKTCVEIEEREILALHLCPFLIHIRSPFRSHGAIFAVTKRALFADVG